MIQRLLRKILGNKIIGDLMYYYNQNPLYEIYVMADTNDKWIKVNRLDQNFIYHDNGTIKLGDVSKYVVAYNGGELLDSSNDFFDFPDGIVDIVNTEEDQPYLLSGNEIDFSGNIIKISFEPNFKHPKKGYMVTTLENVSNQPYRVLKFGGLHHNGSEYELLTVTGSYYSSEQFRNWYKVSGEGWIMPNERVSDFNNYGGGVWVYFLEAQDGSSIIIGAVC